jgi:hypothetical protein
MERFRNARRVTVTTTWGEQSSWRERGDLMKQKLLLIGASAIGLVATGAVAGR